MDVLAVIRAIKRHWRLTIPIVVIVVVACAYVVFFNSSTFEATSSYVLLSPPDPPTAEQITANPALGRVHTDNPYARMDQAVLAEVLTKRVNGEVDRSRLAAKGADSRYQVATGGVYGVVSSPTADITGTADSAAGAMNTVNLVGDRFQRDLISMQAAEGTDPKYMVRAEVIDPPTSATESAGGRVRSLAAVLGLGALLLFIAVSIGEAFENVKRERLARRSKFVLPYADLHDHNGKHGQSAPGSPGVPTPGKVPTPGNGSTAPSSTNGGSRISQR